MTKPLDKPKRKDPVPHAPADPAAGGAQPHRLRLTAAAAEGRFELQVCADCGTVQYPPREACRAACRRGSNGARPTTATCSPRPCCTTNDLFFRERLPWRLGIVALDAGPTRVVHLHGDVRRRPKLRVGAHLDRAKPAG